MQSTKRSAKLFEKLFTFQEIFRTFRPAVLKFSLFKTVAKFPLSFQFALGETSCQAQQVAPTFLNQSNVQEIKATFTNLVWKNSCWENCSSNAASKEKKQVSSALQRGEKLKAAATLV